MFSVRTRESKRHVPTAQPSHGIPAEPPFRLLAPTNVGEWVLEEASDPKFPFRLRIYTPNEPNLSCPFSYRIAGRAATSTSSACAKRASRQTAMRQRRPRGARLHTARPEVEARVRIASDERYPWHLAPFVSERGPLPSGDYALVLGGAVVAVVERKTFDGLLAEFGRMDVLRQRLLELSSYEHHALVIEAPYEDFLNPVRVHHWSAAFCARAIADLYARYATLRIVFCANRKIAETWTRNYFAAVSGMANRGSAEVESPAQHNEGLDGDDHNLDVDETWRIPAPPRPAVRHASTPDPRHHDD